MSSRRTAAALAGGAFALAGLADAVAPNGCSAASLSRGPYLQQVTQESALVVWRTSTAAACTLTATAPGHPAVIVATAAATQHVAALTGLAPGTRYDYAIRSAGPLVSGSTCFLQTAPLPGTGATTRFLVFGDSGTGSSTQSAVAAQINAQTVHFGLHVGDIIYPGGESHYYDPRYFTPYASLLRHTPVWAAIGNHDEVTPSSFLAAWYLPTNPVNGSERFYSFDYGDIHMVALDTTDPFSTSILNWLRSDLENTTRRWKIVFFHHTMYSCGDYHGTSNSLVSLLSPIFEDYGVDLVLYGHDHHYERSYPMRDGDPVAVASDPDYVLPGAPIYVISGAAGTTRSSDENCEHTARAISTPSFVRVEVTGDRLELEAVGTSGSVLDRMTLSKGTAPPPPPPNTAAVMAPNGGEITTVSGTIDLRWTASAALSVVRIELSRTSASGPWETLFPVAINDGHEPWTVTGPASPTCWLRVSDPADGDPSDTSDAPFAIVAAPQPPPPGTAVVRVNFQPASAVVPTGYVADLGGMFDAARSFGWNLTQSVVARGALPGDPRDTFVDVVNDATATWEVVVPNGSYRVSLTCGDTQTSGTHRVALEGQIVVDDEYTVGGEFLQVTDLPVTVADGRLTLTLGGIGNPTHTKVNAIVVVPATSEFVPYTLALPAAGEVRCIGAPATIAWNGGGAPSPLRLEFSRSGTAGPWEVVVSHLVDDGSETFALFGTPSSDCWFRLLDASGAILDMSEGPFSLAHPQIHVLAPNGGETWTPGTEHLFAWTSTCFFGSVRIDVSREGANGPWTPLVNSTPNDGLEPWLVRAEDVGWSHARVVGLPFLVPGDGSDAPFSVSPPPPTLPHQWSIDFAVTGTTPPPGMTLDTGQRFDLDRGYGWHQSVTMKKRDMMPGDCRDSFVQVVNNTSATWELMLANGEYDVTIVCGDPFTSGTHRVALEGEIAVPDVYAVGGQFVTREHRVRVNDSRLTVRLGGSGAITSTKVACLTVTAVTGPQGGGGVNPRDRRELAPAAVFGPTRLDLPVGPLRGATEFALAVGRAGRVRVTVHDVRGRRVAVLVDRDLDQGLHAVRWDAIDAHRTPLASGVYFLRVEAPDASDNHKIVLVR